MRELAILRTLIHELAVHATVKDDIPVLTDVDQLGKELEIIRGLCGAVNDFSTRHNRLDELGDAGLASTVTTFKNNKHG